MVCVAGGIGKHNVSIDLHAGETALGVEVNCAVEAGLELLQGGPKIVITGPHVGHQGILDASVDVHPSLVEFVLHTGSVGLNPQFSSFLDLWSVPRIALKLEPIEDQASHMVLRGRVRNELDAPDELIPDGVFDDKLGVAPLTVLALLGGLRPFIGQSLLQFSQILTRTDGQFGVKRACLGYRLSCLASSRGNRLTLRDGDLTSIGGGGTGRGGSGSSRGGSGSSDLACRGSDLACRGGDLNSIVANLSTTGGQLLLHSGQLIPQFLVFCLLFSQL